MHMRNLAPSNKCLCCDWFASPYIATGVLAASCAQDANFCTEHWCLHFGRTVWSQNMQLRKLSTAQRRDSCVLPHCGMLFHSKQCLAEYPPAGDVMGYTCRRCHGIQGPWACRPSLGLYSVHQQWPMKSDRKRETFSRNWDSEKSNGVVCCNYAPSMCSDVTLSWSQQKALYLKVLYSLNIEPSKPALNPISIRAWRHCLEDFAGGRNLVCLGPI